MSIRLARHNAALVIVAAVVALLTAQTEQSSLAQVPPAPAPGNPATGQTKRAWLIGEAVTNPDSPQYAIVGDAITRFENGKPTEAEDLLKDALRKEPKLPPLEVMMGRLWAASGQPIAGRVELEKAVVSHPNDPDAYLYFAEAALMDRRVTDGEALLLVAKPLVEKFAANDKRKNGFNLRLNSGLAAVSEQREKWPDAEGYLTKLVGLDPDNKLGGYQRMARALFKRGDFRKAYEQLTTATEIAKKNDEKMTNPAIVMAYFYEEDKNRVESKKMLKFAVDNFPKDLNVLLAAARLALATGELDNAKTYADAAQKLEPDSVDVMIVGGQIARFRGDLLGAEKMLQRAVTTQPGNIDASNQLALALLDQNDPGKAKTALQYAALNASATTQGNRANPIVLSTYAYALYKNDEKPQAEQLLARLLQAGPVNQDTAYYIAQILRDKGELDNAARALESAINNASPFAQRKATEKLLAEIKADIKKQQEAEKGGDKGKDALPTSKSK